MVQNHLNKLSIPLRQKAPGETLWKLDKRFQRRHLKLHNFIYVYWLGARVDNPLGGGGGGGGDKILIVSNKFNYFNHKL